MTASTVQARRLQQREDARRAILAETEAILLEGGAEALSIRPLAERCGCTAPTIYHYFGDKQGLVDALLEERFHELHRALEKVPESEDPLETVRSRSRAFVAFGLRNPVHYRLLTVAREPGTDPPPAAEAAREFLERPWQQLAEQGRLRPPDIEICQRALWAAVHGLLSLHSSRPDLEWPQAVFDESVDAVLRGLVAPPEPEAPERRKRPRRDRRTG